ncbi:hypothetical protein [Flaviaesturariibacter amylovorans]|uniref:DUF3619 family protein n=1 Tax=Flaviaesturariibacter amylovorans TaxID=1084520 RepID=A0ABP8HFM7_9BACT
MSEERDQKIDAILASLDGAARAEAPPYLYSKIRNRLQAPAALPVRLAGRLALALAIVAVLNVLTLRSAGAAEDPVAAAHAQAIAADYSITLPDTY